MKNIFVIGSINYDLVIDSPYMPKNGETITGSGFVTNSGGKGANQAVACKKLGGNVFMLGAVGDDSMGKEGLNSLQSYGVNTDFVQVIKNCNTGVAVIIIVDSDNRIILDTGANYKFDKEEMYKNINGNVKEGDIVICQLEIPLEVIEKGFKIAKELGAITILNPAPAKEIPSSILECTDIFIPNKSEAEIISKIEITDNESIQNVMTYLKSFNIKDIIITLGSKGSVHYDGESLQFFDAIKVKAVDTTSAGDTFIGALASQIAMNKQIKESIDLCNKAAAITVTRKGAQVSIPTLEEVKLL